MVGGLAQGVALCVALACGFLLAQVSRCLPEERAREARVQPWIQPVAQALEPLGRKEFAHKCTRDEMKWLLSRNPLRSSCPNQDGWLPFHARARRANDSTLVFVGCNKGYDFVKGMRMWSQNNSYSVEQTAKTHENAGSGACQSGAKKDIAVGDSSILHIRGYCIEPMEENVALLENSFAKLGYAPPQVTITKAAVGSLPGWVVFPRARVGTENVGINRILSSNDSSRAIPVLNLDNYFLEQNIGVIDWLSIDTEGNDARVLLGLVRSLGAKKIRALEFEVHAVNHWSVSSLEDLSDMLDNFGFTCYWETNGGDVIQLSGCWDDSYLNQRWKNVVCVLRSEPLFDLLNALAWRKDR